MSETRDFYLDGVLVGRAESSGDDALDRERMIRLLKEKGLYKETTTIQAIFRQAISFATVSSDLYRRDLAKVPAKMLSVAPFVVNAAFAIELYIKTLGEIYATSLRGHDLLILFDALPAEAHSALLGHFSSARWQANISTLEDYREAIEQMRNAFVEWRYLHEKMMAGEIRFPSMIFVMEVLHATCAADLQTT